MELLLNNSGHAGKRADGTPLPGAVADGLGNYLTEHPSVGSSELWELVNLTDDTHAIHLHLAQFQIVNRQAFDVAGYNAAYNAAFPGGARISRYGPPMPYFGTAKLGGNPDVAPFLMGSANPPAPEEAGWKDTIKVPPNMIT